MSHQFTATSTQIQAVQILRDYINRSLGESSNTIIDKAVKELWTLEQFESYQVSIRNAMELTAQVYFDKGPYKSNSAKRKDRRLCSLMGHQY
jgi:hypothetical protein